MGRQWFLKAQYTTGGGSSKLSELTDVELSSSYLLHPGKVLMLTHLDNPRRFRWQEHSLFIDFYDALVLPPFGWRDDHQMAKSIMMDASRQRMA